MNYYTYKLTLKPDPRYYYYGVRKTSVNPEEDTYLGSGRGVQELKVLHGKDCFRKEVLSTFKTRQESLLEEQRLVGDLWKTDPFCLNRMPGGAFGGEFDATGLLTYHSGSKIRHIRPEAVKSFEELGWVKGLPESRAAEIRRYISIFKGEEERRIFPEDLKIWEKEGWQRGRSVRNLQELRSRIHITDGTRTKYIHSGSLERYLKEGWTVGHSSVHTERSRDWNKGSIYIFKDQVTTKIQKEDLPKFLSEGWQKGNLGTRKNRTEDQKDRSRETQKGRVWINNGVVCKKIWPQDREKYPDWINGRLPGQAPTTQGRVKMYNPSTGKKVVVDPTLVSKFQEEGFFKGRGF